MSRIADVLFLAIVALDLYFVSTSRLAARVQACALQGAALAALPLVWLVSGSVPPERTWHVVVAAVATLLFKAVAIPFYLRRAMRDTNVHREVEPSVSLHAALLVAAALVGLSFALSARLIPPEPLQSPLAVPAGFATLRVGLYLTVSGRTALTQVMGYLVAENGVFVIGQSMLGEFPLVVEIGLLLDVLVAVMLMAVFFVLVHDGEPAPASDGEPPPTHATRTEAH